MEDNRYNTRYKLDSLTKEAIEIITEKTAYEFEKFLKEKINTKDICITDLKDENGWNVLHHICKENRVSFCKVLVRMNNWATLTKDFRKKVQIIPEMKQSLVEANEWDNSLTPLHKLIRTGLSDAARDLILSKGTGGTDSEGYSAVTWCCVTGDTKVFDTLKVAVNPTEITKEKQTLLHIACISGTKDLLSPLVAECGVDVKAVANMEKRPRIM